MTVVADDRLFTFWRRTEDADDEDGAGMRVARIRRRCGQLIDELALPPRTGLPALCDAVARRVGRPIHLVPMRLDGVVSGMTATTDDAYWIVHELRTSPWHQAHIVLHELGHLLLGHDQDPTVTENALKVWTPSVDVATAMRRMGLAMGLARHHCYDDLTERETEVLATLLMEKVVPPPPGEDRPLTGPAAALAASLGPALEHVRRARADGEGGGGV
ncbi:hypothetical protein I5Q34_24140 [Streptomyces sp. AV19]|uniref:hypothetical protein n=1 Tax=Streptomyces sp. AV19 TaxID=2793068 RepID=UPI0018FF0D75|nr:hypothetical protein [Streptomyces sp. AV19]MBH1937323.1 hypothetical protein [Streptomyces sp. AV19]MDG4534668.1 hypothetical protein [Streptomyces sp. AV19]